MRAGSDYCRDMWRTFLGWLSWYAEVRQGLLATFDRVYSDMRHIDRQAERDQRPASGITL